MGHPFLRKKASGSKETEQKPRASVKNREFAVITYCFFGLFLSMMGYFVYFQTEKSEDFINNPYNARQETFALRPPWKDLLFGREGFGGDKDG